MAKYTDEQIKKALELIASGVGSAKRELCIAIHDLINRQEAEIKRYKYALERANKYGTGADAENKRLIAEIERLKEKNRLANQCTPKAIRRAKSEAIKEFAESIKSYIDAYVVFEYAAGEQDLLDCIDNLVKEMVGEGE